VIIDASVNISVFLVNFDPAAGWVHAYKNNVIKNIKSSLI
jgi:hypothetical protein